MSDNEAPHSGDEKETGRTEAFSDGVFAIAITLLILEIRVPHTEPGGEPLTALLLKQWPSYAAYVLSFLVIAVMWSSPMVRCGVGKARGCGFPAVPVPNSPR